MQNNVYKEIDFEILQSNYGTQILVFNDEDLDIILRNNSKNMRDYNKENKNVKYKIKIEKIKDVK